MQILRLALVAAALATAANAAAQDADATPEDKGPWTGSFSVGYLSSKGNTDSQSTNVDLDVTYLSKPWEHRLKGRAYGASQEGETTAEAYQAGWKSSYDFDPRNYAFGALDWNKDRFAGFTRQTFATVGYGRRILTGEDFVLSVEIGAGYAEQKPAVGSTESGATGSLGGDFTWNFSDNGSFEQTLYMFTTSENTFWQSVSKVTAGLVGNLGLSVSYTIRRNSDVPPGTDKTDRLTAVSLEYKF